MTTRLIVFLLIGVVMMPGAIVMQMKWYHIKAWKSAFVSIAIILTGLVGAELLFFVENGYWGGKSFYGAIFLSPLVFLLLSRLLRIPFLYSLDFCSTAGCLMLSILKIQCILDGCCKGIILYTNRDLIYVRFPSQAVELAVAVILFVLLLILSHNPKYRGRLYPITLVLYGSTRFVLNLLRDDWERMREMNLPLPIGNIWSLIAIAIGLTWLILDKKKKQHDPTETC